MWPQVYDSLGPGLRHTLFSSPGQPRQRIRDAMEFACRKLQLRHVFGSEGAQAWLRTVYLQFGVSDAGWKMSRPPFAGTYWTAPQQLAHLTVNGARLRTGDLFASGTVSGPGRDQVGSLIELTEGGRRPIRLGDGTTRTFLADGDVVTIGATAPGPDGAVIGFGEVSGTVLPAREG